MKEGLRGGRAVPSGEIDPHRDWRFLFCLVLKNLVFVFLRMTFEDFFIFEFDPTDFKFKVYSWINFDSRIPPMKHKNETQDSEHNHHLFRFPPALYNPSLQATGDLLSVTIDLVCVLYNF